MDKFIIKLSDGSRYLATPEVINDQVAYIVLIGNHSIRFISNPNWDIDNILLIPDTVPVGSDISLLREIADYIENHFC